MTLTLSIRKFLVLVVIAAIGTVAFGASKASALNPPQTTVTGTVNQTYWDLQAFWKPLLTYFNYRYVGATVNYYNHVSGGSVVDYPTNCGSTAGYHGSFGFYCPPVSQIHLDFTQLNGVLSRYGDGAVALWLAHETGHHIQKLLGVRRAAPNGELQADCFAGLYIRFGYSKSGTVGWSDYQEARNQLWALGSSQSHGTNAQRLAALDYGFKTFTLQSCLNAY